MSAALLLRRLGGSSPALSAALRSSPNAFASASTSASIPPRSPPPALAFPDAPPPASASSPIRRFFSSSSSLTSAAGELSSLLDREIEDERESDTVAMPEVLSDLMAKVEERWRVVGSGATIKLFKKDNAPGGAKVSITFHCQDTMTTGGEEEPEGGSDFGAVDEEEQGREEEESVAVRFTTAVSRQGKTMLLSCLSDGEGAIVEAAAFVPGGDTESDKESVQSGRLDDALYQGPEFGELAEDLQLAFSSFLQTDCGVDEDVACFVSMYADYREQVEYTGWLEGMRSLVSQSD